MKANAVPHRQGEPGAEMMSGPRGQHHELRRTLSPCATPAHVRRHHVLLLVVLIGSGCTKPDKASSASVPVEDAGAAAAKLKGRLLTVGPRMLSNQTSQPISVTGE